MFLFRYERTLINVLIEKDGSPLRRLLMQLHSVLKCRISSNFFLWSNIDEKFYYLVPLALSGIKVCRKNTKGQQRL